jgi:predicted dehydrogenase
MERQERTEVMHSRRNFIEGATAGLVVALARPARVFGANNKIRLGIIGAGARGKEIMQLALSCPDTEIIGIADIYTRRLEEGKKYASNAKTYLDYRHLLEDKSIDAVLIATPQHLHCEHFVASIDAGKHVYQEKTMAFTVEHAKRMRAAYQRAGKRTVQVGFQGCSTGQNADAKEFLKDDTMGKITAIHSHMYRNTPHGHPQWTRPILPDMTEESIIWKSFEGDTAHHDFDPNRYINWRFYWDYSGGNFYENMCHQLAFWYKLMGLKIPTVVYTGGGVYLWKDGREVPDTMSVSMEHQEEILFTWDSGFGNSELGITDHVLGTDGTIINASEMNGPVRYIPQKVNRPDGTELQGQQRTPVNAHMKNFLDCIRSGQEPNAPFDLGFRVSIACRMAVDSYRFRRSLRWDPEKEEIV